MPSLEWNFETWNNDEVWAQRGDDWSIPWGSPEAQWHFILLPRIHRFLPANSIVEIGPGLGRWTQFLLPQCQSFTGVDLSWKGIEGCRRRFSEQPHSTFHTNDGYSLDMLSDESIDFAFSFDSLVHTEWDVVSSYLRELARVLKPNGAAFLHHSNLAAVPDHSIGLKHARAATVSGELVLSESEALGLSVVSQERFDWGADNPGLTDCMTVLTRAHHALPAVVDNPGFMCEVTHIGPIAHLYAPPGTAVSKKST